MKKVVKDITQFGMGSLVVGGGAAVVGKAVGGTYAGGLSTVGSMMSPIGSMMMAKHGVRIASKALPKFRTKKKGRF